MSILSDIGVDPSIFAKKAIISFTTNKRNYTAHNNEKKMIYEYHKLDEHASFLDQKCVDYALYVEGDNLLYLIELKGSDLNHAYEQVLETFKMLQRDIKLKRGDARGRIVIGKVKRPALKSPEIKRLIKECKTEKLDVLCQTQQIIEDI